MVAPVYKKYAQFNNNIFILGFGSIGQAILPLLLRHLAIQPHQIIILTKNNERIALANAYGVALQVLTFTKENYQALLDARLRANDFLLNLSVDVSSEALISYCQEKAVLYLDTCIEPWAGGYTDAALSAVMRTNYAMRESALSLRKGDAKKKTTALIAHGANPGLVSHFVKQGLLNMASDNGLAISVPQTQKQWAQLAQQLKIKSIHIAERDTQITHRPRQLGEFVNTWSIDGFLAESAQPAELGWGTHERHWPAAGEQHDFGSQCAIYINRPGAALRVRSWTPHSGSFHGFLITHTEAISIANYFTLKDGDALTYRPTVHFAYHPCEQAFLSVNELMGREWQSHQPANHRLLLDDIVDGMDELGVLLMGNPKGAYWFGSQLSIQAARQLAPHNNATSLQVAIGALSGLIWVMAHPQAGIVEPDEIDFNDILEIAKPYLGNVSGHYTDWTPLKEREKLFPEKIDRSDPWQFINVLVS